MRRLPLLLVVLVLVAGACGDDGDPTLSAGDDTTSTTAGGGMTPGEPLGGDTSPTSAPAPAAIEGVAHLTDVRAATHDGSARVVFEFEEGVVPGYEVRYADGPFTEPGSGREVAVDGEAYLHLRLDPARVADLEGEEPRITYDGPDRLSPDAAGIVELVLLGDFEANMEWVVGLDGRRAFRVSTLDGPPRIVVDIDAG